MELVGKEQYRKFAANCLDKKDVALCEPISKNKLDFLYKVAEKCFQEKIRISHPVRRITYCFPGFILLTKLGKVI